MCKELYQRWYGCDCWGLMKVDVCTELFKSCFGPGGEKDKMVAVWNDGMCSECWDRLLLEAEEEAKAARLAEEESERIAAASSSSKSYSTSSGDTPG